MKLVLENIGKIKRADIELNGITVIAGENNTGKSTVSKVLFAVVNSLYRGSEQVHDQRDASVFNILANLFRTDGFNCELKSDMILNVYDHGELVDSCELKKYNEDKNGLIVILATFATKLGIDYTPLESTYEHAAERILDMVKMPDEEIQTATLLSLVNIELDGQINNLNLPDSIGHVNFQYNDVDVNLSIKDCSNQGLIGTHTINSSAYYIESPYQMDRTYGRNPHESFISRYHSHHNSHIQYFLKPSVLHPKNIVDEILDEKILARVMKKLNAVCTGSLKRTGGVRYQYHDSNTNISYKLRNLSTGIKSFLIIKTLLLNNSLKHGDVLIFDEPEVHLHPKWQVSFAELLVLLQQEMGLHIFINTHSADFLEAIEVYSQRHGIVDKCKYYLAEDNDNYSLINDVTNSTDKIYEKLLSVVQLLENERYSDND